MLAVGFMGAFLVLLCFAGWTSKLSVGGGKLGCGVELAECGAE